MIRQASILAAALVLEAGVAMAGGPFDGQWKGSSDGIRGTCMGADIVMTVADGKATGELEARMGKPPVGGTVAADGKFTGRAGAAPLTGKFEGDNFIGTLDTKICGQRPVRMRRVK